MSGCVARFREGNGSCVHRFLSPGGVPFCVARGRVFFCHSLSQVSLLGRNLNTVFLRVNNLEDFFSGAARPAAPSEASAGSPPGTIADVGAHRTKYSSSKTLHVSRGFSRTPASAAVVHGSARVRAAMPNGSGTGGSRDVVAARRTRRVPASHKVVCAKTARASRRVAPADRTSGDVVGGRRRRCRAPRDDATWRAEQPVGRRRASPQRRRPRRSAAFGSTHCGNLSALRSARRSRRAPAGR